MKLHELLTRAEIEALYVRFDRKVKKDPYGCLIWTGEQSPRGYGIVVVERGGKRYKFSAHRLNYERHHGRIRRGLVVDHLCRNKSCVNPSLKHLEAVTNAENVRREAAARHGSEPGIRCKNGHEKMYRRDPKSQKLICRGCNRLRVQAHYWKNKGRPGRRKTRR